MPTATYLPIASKYGRITVNSTVLNLSEHELRAAADDIDTTHFESDVSADGAAVYEEGLVGITSGDIMVRGMFDGANNPIKSPIYLWPGYFGSVFLGLSKTYGFTCGYRCLQTPISAAVRRAASFEARIKSNGLITLPSTNYTTTTYSGS